MNRFNNIPGLLLMIILMMGHVNVRAFDQESPDFTLLWNRFDHLVAKGQYVLGCSQRGITVAKYDADESRFKSVGEYELKLSPQQAKLFGDMLVVKGNGNELSFVDIGQLPKVELKGVVELDSEFSDFCMVAGDLVVSRWFDGITRYELTGFNSASFTDSSLKGVLVTQLEQENDTLYVLDEYNGIMRYDLSAPIMMKFIDYLWVPHRPASFVKSDEIFTISLVNSGLMFGQFGLAESIIDSLMDLLPARSLYQTDSTIVQVNDRSLDLISKNDLSVSDTITISQVSTAGSIVEAGGTSWLALPANSGGFMIFDVEGGGRPKQGFARPGPVSELMLYGGKLIVGGEANPIDVFTTFRETIPVIDTTINENLNIVSDFVRTKDSLIVFYSHDINSIAIYSDITDSLFPFYLQSYMPTDTLGFSRTFLSDYVPHDSLRFFVIQKEHIIEAYALMEYGELRYIGRWSYFGRIESFTIQGRYVYAVTSKGTLWVHHIEDDYNRTLITSASVYRNTSGMIARSNRLWIFENRKVTLLDISDPSLPSVDTIFNLPIAVGDLEFIGDSLYTVGYEGIGIYNLDQSYPELVWSSPWPGRTITVDSNFIAVSDGSAVDLFINPASVSTGGIPSNQLPRLFVLEPNYPNPFNGSTVIRFEMKITAPVELSVYNGLGQKVKDLAWGVKAAGSHEIEWDGRDRKGRLVASGVYLYQLRVLDEKGARKMVYLK